MNNIFFLITLVVFFISNFLYTKYNLHMFQLNYYKIKEHLKWIRKNVKKIFIKSFWNILILFLTNGNSISSILVISLFLIMAFMNRTKKEKKPFVYTNRMKNMLATINLFSLIIIIFVKIKFENQYIISMAILNLLTPISILIVNYINMPINVIIKKKYINDAKKKINGMTNLVVIGITGSYGKTSMKHFLEKILSSDYNVLATPQNYNTTLGVVKTIRENLRATHQVFICEMGATKKNDIKEICDLVHPRYGIITSIGEQHLESFKTIENIINTKFELADSIPQNGLVFLNADNDKIKTKDNKSNYIYYGTKDDKNKYYAYDIENTQDGLKFKMMLDGEEIEFSSKLLGEHNVINIVGAISIAKELGIETSKIKSKVRLLETAEHRLQIVQRGENIIIDDAYNSNPAGARAALNVLASLEGIKILITPGMIELGVKQYECNFEFGQYASQKCDYIILVGEKQTKPIQEGIRQEGFYEEKLWVVESLDEALSKVKQIGELGRKKIILLENDLPDNY